MLLWLWPVAPVLSALGGLADVGNLLRLINASPFHESYSFRSAIEHPFYASVEAAAAASDKSGQQPRSTAPGSVADDDDDDHGHAGFGDDDESFDAMDCCPADAGAGGTDAMAIGGARAAQPLPSDSAAAAAAGARAADGASPVVTALSAALAPRYGRHERDGVRRLMALLQPLMWRTSKAVADMDHPLPPR